MLPGEDAHWDQAQKNLILSESDDLLATAANDVGCGEPKQRDPKHNVMYVARMLGDPAV